MIIGIVAMDENNLIGNPNSKYGMPWHNKEDLQHFKEETMGKTILMGRTTYEAVGKEFKGREVIVVTRDKNFQTKYPNESVVHDAKSLIEEYADSYSVLYIAGGKSIYEQFMDYMDILLVSRINGSHEGNVYFPDFENDFKLFKTLPHKTFNLEIYLNCTNKEYKEINDVVNRG